MAKRKIPQWLLPVAYMLAFGTVWYSLQHFSNTVQPKQVPYSDFLLKVRSGHVSEVGIDEQLFVATLMTDAANKEFAPQISTQRIPGLFQSTSREVHFGSNPFPNGDTTCIFSRRLGKQAPRRPHVTTGSCRAGDSFTVATSNCGCYMLLATAKANVPKRLVAIDFMGSGTPIFYRILLRPFIGYLPPGSSAI